MVTWSDWVNIVAWFAPHFAKYFSLLLGFLVGSVGLYVWLKGGRLL